MEKKQDEPSELTTKDNLAHAMTSVPLALIQPKLNKNDLEHTSSAGAQECYKIENCYGNIYAAPVYNIKDCKVIISADNAISMTPRTLKRCTEKLISITEIIKDLKYKLKERYQATVLPTVAFLDEGSSFNMKDHYTDLQLNSSKEIIHLEHLFDDLIVANALSRLHEDCSNLPTKRILIEGQPGMGKTTLANKIIFDWATGEKYLKKFELAFCLHLREIDQQTVLSELKDILKESDCRSCNDDDTIQEIFEQYEEEILLILDGFDELAEEQRATVNRVLFKKELHTATIVLTCRTGLFSISTEEMNSLFKGHATKKDFYDKRVSILGILEERIPEFLLKFSPECNSEKILNHLKNLTSNVKQLFRNPLFLILLAFISQEVDDPILYLNTQTKLYQKLVNCIINRSLQRDKLSTKQSSATIIDVFCSDSSAGDIPNLLMTFGEATFQKILTNNLTFRGDDSVAQQVYKLGLLINHKKQIKFKTVFHFEAFHLSLLEFTCAYAVWRNVHLHQLATNFVLKRQISELYFKRWNTTPIFKFIFELLHEQTDELFLQIESTSHIYSSNFYRFWNIVKNNYTSNSFEKHILKFVTPDFTIQSFKLCEEYQNSLKQFSFHGIVHLGANAYSLSDYILCDIQTHIITISLPLDSSKLSLTEWFIKKHAKCRILYLKVLENCNDQDFLNLLCSLICLPVQEVALQLYSSKNSLIDPCPLTEMQTRLTYLGCIMTKCNYLNYKNVLTILFDKKQLKTLVISAYDSESIETFLDIIPMLASSSVETLHFTNASHENIKIDLYQLTNEKHKAWKYLDFKNVELISVEDCYDGQRNACIYSLSLNYPCKVSKVTLQFYSITVLMYA